MSKTIGSDRLTEVEMKLVSQIGFAVALCTIALSLGLESWAYADEPALAIVDPKATTETKNLYGRLHRQAGRGILFGHQDSHGRLWLYLQPPESPTIVLPVCVPTPSR